MTMIFEYLSFLSIICILFILSFVIFFLISMKTREEYGFRIWGAVFSLCGILISSLVICSIIIKLYLRNH